MEFDDKNSDARKMLLVAAALGGNISELYEVYSELYNRLDLDNPEIASMMLDILAEYENNLHDIMGLVDAQIYNLTGVHEPIPDEVVEDFEASILDTIGKLDEVNLDDYRIEYEDE